MNTFSINFVIILGNSGPWILGEPGETCQQVCNKKGQYCNAEMQSTLTTNELLAEKMAEAGYTCKGFHGARNYAGSPFSTGRNDDCGPMTSGSKSVCDGQSYSSHRSLCYCEGGKIKCTQMIELRLKKLQRQFHYKYSK